MPKPYSVDDLNRVIQEFRDYNEQNVYSEEDARDYLFERALETGELDEDVIRAMEDRYSNSDDLVVDDRPEFDLSEARYNRNLLDVSDYGGRIPYRGLDIDPDYEDYRAYNFLNANPKYRAFLEQQIFELPDRSAAQEEVLNALRTGALDSRDLSLLSTAGYSEILENVPENSDNFAYEIADELNRAATSNEQTPSFRNIYSNAAESLNNLDPLISLPKQIRGLEGQRESLDRAIRNAQSGRLIQGNFPGTREQLELNVQQEDPRDALIRRAQQAISESQEPLSSSADIEQRRNLLYQLQRDLSYLESDRAIRQAARRNLVLPAVENFLREREFEDVLRNIETDEIAQRTPVDPFVERAYESDAVLRAVNANRSQMTGVAPPLVARNAPRQLVIPGLNEEISNIVRQARFDEQKIPIETLKQVVSQYPEIETLLNTELSTSERPRLRGPQAKQYLKYVDTAQFITSPEDRADLYRKILSTRNVSDDPVLINQLNQIERAFTSGNPEEQRFAIQSLNNLGVGEDLNRIAEPATSSVLPIVGGGGYVRPTEEILESLDDRAQALRSAVRDVDLEVLKELYPGVSSNPQKIYQQEFIYDPKTESVQPLTPGLKTDLPTYGIDMRVSENEGISPGSASAIPNPVSANVLRFLQDNPILNRANITFTTKAPGTGGYNYDEKNLPAAVSRAFAQFAQQNALRDLKPGTLVTNSPADSLGLYRLKVRAGETPETSSTVRKLQPFVEEGYSIPNLRGAAYQSVGFGPTDKLGTQFTYIDQRGNAIPLQMRPAEEGLRGKVRVSPEGDVVVRQGRLPKTTKAYYSLDPTTPVVEAIRQNPRGAVAGAALSLLNDEVAKAIAKDDVASAATAFGVDVGAGALSEAAIKGAGNILTRVAPQVAATVNPAVAGAASIALPAVVGVGLLGQGRDNSALNVLTRKAADVNARVLPFTRTDPRTDIGRRLGQQILNEGRYIFNRLRQNQIPYLPGQRYR